MEDCISNGDGVILCKGASSTYIKARPGNRERMENFNVFANDMIGKPFGTAFKVNGKQLVQIDPWSLDNEDEGDRNGEQTKDNRMIVDDSNAQKMSRDDIMKLKEEGKDGDEIVGKIIDSSATFKEKTVYSQAKYLKKKKKKHLAHFITHKPSARLLCQLFFNKAAVKILEIRPDTLGQILTWSNVQSGSNVLLVETCQGLLLGSFLERLGNAGQIVQAYSGDFPVRIILNQFNITDSTKSDRICGFSLERLDELKKCLQDRKTNQVSETSNNADSTGENTVKEKDSEVMPEVKTDATEIDSTENEKTKFQNRDGIACSAMYSKDQKLDEENRALSYLEKKNFNSLIIASKFHPKNLMVELIEYVKPSSPIIIYCQFKEPLMECYEYLREESLAVNINVSDTWFRDIQVLPNRTHPGIMMSARGGYILRAITVKKEEDDNSEPELKKQKIE